MNIHLKEAGPKGELVKIVADYLRDHNLLDLAYIAGEADVLEAALEYSPRLPRACLASQDDPMKMIAVATRYQCSRVQFYRKFFSTEYIAVDHEADLVCNFFLVRRAD